ncbi:MAG: hypothetical protein UMV23_04180 [Halanaerobium sp.]|nr:hypothetical protein [Halanaerobium sp.]
MRRPSLFMMISIKAEDLKHRIMIPLPLFLMSELLDCLVYLTYLYTKFSKKERPLKRLLGKVPYLQEDFGQLDEVQLVEMAADLFSELRRYGSFTLLEVRDGDTQVKIRMI